MNHDSADNADNDSGRHSVYVLAYDSDDDSVNYLVQDPLPGAPERPQSTMNNCEICTVLFTLVFMILYWTLIFYSR